jgi:hypothetical protein
MELELTDDEYLDYMTSDSEDLTETDGAEDDEEDEYGEGDEAYSYHNSESENEEDKMAARTLNLGKESESKLLIF